MKNEIGYFGWTPNKLPYFDYIGKLPYREVLENGTKVKLPEDPWFLLGNYQLTLFTHVSGEYELITGQRSWGRVNQGWRENSGANYARVGIIDEKGNSTRIELTGTESLAADPDYCRRRFGCGFAEYEYRTQELRIVRTLSVKPSVNYKDGASAFVLTVLLTNEGLRTHRICYEEGVIANYKEIQFQRQEKSRVVYQNHFVESMEDKLVQVQITGDCIDPLLTGKREDMSKVEGFPPALFMKAVSEALELSGDKNGLHVKKYVRLESKETITICVIIGYSFEYGVSNIKDICNQLGSSQSENTVGLFEENWMECLPSFKQEMNETRKREMIWHAYNLEAMATYSEYYDETKIPQGTIYDYDWGAHASARDNFQHALPLIYYNAELAKSVLRYMMKRTTPFGEIRLIETGNGYASSERYFTSDQQLFFFLLMSEYLRVTGDYDFLLEEVAYYPVVNQNRASVADFIKKCFLFLRDEIGVGEHGLVKLLNSDWNDAVYYIEKVPYNNVFFTGESHMNSAMAVSVLQTLIHELENAVEKLPESLIQKELLLVADSMKHYRSEILSAFLKDMGERSFPKRMYFNNKPYGEENMFLEPMGYTLMMQELPVKKKRIIYQEMKKRVYNGEVLGAREQEQPEFEDEAFDKGSRENGGFWWALNGPVILGVKTFDKKEAWGLLENMRMENFSRNFPKYWSAYWSAADNIESSLIPEKGLPDQSLTYWSIPVYCAHPHAWILYCYYVLSDELREPYKNTSK